MKIKIRTWGKEIWDKKQTEQGSLGVIAGTVETKDFMNNQTSREFKIINNTVLPLLPKKAKILDAGVGPFARFSIEFAKLGYSVIGIDISPKVLKMARKAISSSQYKINLIEDDLTNIRKIKEKQDLVFCFGTFGHIPSFLSLNVIKEFNKILRGGGYAYIYFWINKEKKLKHIMHDFLYDIGYYAKRKIGSVYKVNSSFYTEEEIGEMVRIGGFEIISRHDGAYLLKKIQSFKDPS